MKTGIAIFLASVALTLAQDSARDPVVLAVQKALPAVVNISTEQIIARNPRDPFEQMFRQFFGEPRDGGQSLGSGVIVDSDGWLITNFHVIRRASRITVRLADGSTHEARFVSGDERNDLALLKIDAGQPLPTVELASESEPLLGETVIAIGNPYGFDHTVTKGIISAKNRLWPPDDPKFEDVLQTDAAINPGNSGGPLINTRGELVGINSAILSQAQGIGFAIPAKRVVGLLTAWLSPEKRTRVWLGLRFARAAGNLIVADVQPDSPAAKAGLTTSNIVVAVDGQRFDNVLQLQRYVLRKKAGDELKFELPAKRVVLVQLTALPKLSVAELFAGKFGLTVQPLTRELAQALGFVTVRGLLISEVQKGSPAAEVGLRRGMIITSLAGEEWESLDRLAEQLADIKAGDLVSLGIFVSERRGGYTLQQTVAVTLPAR
jgi:S1-C subfamily serine protease